MGALYNARYNMVMSRLFSQFAALRLSSVQVFFLSLAYYVSLYFSINNRSFLIFTCLYVILLWWRLRSLELVFFLSLIATMPFAKGWAYEIVLLPWQQIQQWALFPIVYFFPVYIASAFLFLSFYLYIRKHRGRSAAVRLPTLPLVVFTGFIFWSLVGSVGSPFPSVSILSVIQLIELFILLCLPSLLFDRSDKLSSYVIGIVAATLIYESGWAIAQWLHGGPLGRDIEVYLPGNQFGIGSSENFSLLRVTGTFFDPSILGTFLVMQMIIFLQLLLHKRMYKTGRYLLGLLIVMGSVALIFTGSRVIYGIWFISVIVLSWSKRRDVVRAIHLVMRQHWLLLVGCVSLVAAYISPYVISRVSSLSNVFTEYGSATYRIQMVIYAARLVMSRPLIGGGVSQSPYYYATAFIGEKLRFDPTYPHNLFAQLSIETGLIGALLFAAFLIIVFRRAFRAKVINEFALAAGAFTLCAMFYPIFINRQEIISYLFLYIGLYYATTRRNLPRAK